MCQRFSAVPNRPSIKNSIFRSLFAFSFVTLILIQVKFASAQDNDRSYIVAPNEYENQRGNWATNPAIQWVPTSLQQIYHEDQLDEFIDFDISSITYRLVPNLPGDFPFVDTTWDQYDIFIGQGVSPELANEAFADNFVGEIKQVRSGSLTIQARSFSPDSWGFEIEFDEPFLYTGGHLTLLTRHTGTPGNTSQGNRLLDSLADFDPGFGTDVSALFEFDENAEIGRLGFNPAITRFGAVASSVPEPTTAIPVALAFTLLLSVRKRKQR